MQDYKSLCVVIMICSTLVNIQTDTQTYKQTYRQTHSFDQLYYRVTR